MHRSAASLLTRDGVHCSSKPPEPAHRNPLLDEESKETRFRAISMFERVGGQNKLPDGRRLSKPVQDVHGDHACQLPWVTQARPSHGHQRTGYH